MGERTKADPFKTVSQNREIMRLMDLSIQIHSWKKEARVILEIKSLYQCFWKYFCEREVPRKKSVFKKALINIWAPNKTSLKNIWPGTRFYRPNNGTKRPRKSVQRTRKYKSTGRQPEQPAARALLFSGGVGICILRNNAGLPRPKRTVASALWMGLLISIYHISSSDTLQLFFRGKGSSSLG